MNESPGRPALESIDHVAISVRSIAESVEWYSSRFRCKVIYRDETWAMLAFDNIRLALIASGTHPPHIGFVRPDAESFGPLKPHRDGTQSTYITDPSGNTIEILAHRTSATKEREHR